MCQEPWAMICSARVAFVSKSSGRTPSYVLIVLTSRSSCWLFSSSVYTTKFEEPVPTMWMIVGSPGIGFSIGMTLLSESLYTFGCGGVVVVVVGAEVVM